MAVLNVNGKVLNHNADPRTPLLWVLREQLGLTGTKYGCGIAQCGRMHRPRRRRSHALLLVPGEWRGRH